jgi:tryptophan synthase alpha chain
VIELGVPFSDPLGDGPSSSAPANARLARGTRLIDVLALAADLRAPVPMPAWSSFLI